MLNKNFCKPRYWLFIGRCLIDYSYINNVAFQGKHTIAHPENQVLVLLTYITNSRPLTLSTSFFVKDAVEERIWMVLGMWLGPVMGLGLGPVIGQGILC